MQHNQQSIRSSDDNAEDAVSDNLAAVNQRLGELTQQLERMAQANADTPSPSGGADNSTDRVAEALARLRPPA